MSHQDRSKRAQEPPRAAQDPLKTAQKPLKTFQRGPKSPQEQPKTLLRRPKSLQGPCWDGLGAILRPSDHKIENQTAEDEYLENLCVDFGSQNAPQNDPKTSPKSRQKMHDFLIALGPVLDRS